MNEQQNKTKSFFIKTVLIILATGFVLSGMLNFFTGIGQNNIVKINNKKINISEFLEFLTRKRNQYYNSDLNDSDIAYLNSQAFINKSLNEFINENLFELKINDLLLKEPKRAALYDISQLDFLKDNEGKFNKNLFQDTLVQLNIKEQDYIKFIINYNSRNSLIQLLSFNLSNNFFSKELLENENTYIIADIIEISPKYDLKSKIKQASKQEIENFYQNNKDSFYIPETKIISYVDIDFSNNKNEDLEQKINELQDSILSSQHIDEIANLYKVKKYTISYVENSNERYPDDLTNEIVQYDKYIFSDIIYKNNNKYRVYFIEDIKQSKVLTLEEATPNIIAILSKQEKEKNNKFLLDKLMTQMKTNGVHNTAIRNGFRIINNEILYKSNLVYPEQLIKDLYFKPKNNITSPVYDNKKDIYYIASFKKRVKIPSTDNRYINSNKLNEKLLHSSNYSIMSYFQKYLMFSKTIIINKSLYNNIVPKEE